MMKPPVLLVHPDRYLQLADMLRGDVVLQSYGVNNAIPAVSIPPGCAGIEIKQSPYVPLTTQTRQPRPWWAFWRPKYVTTEKPVLGFFYTERGAGEPVPLPRGFAVKNCWPEAL